MLGWVGNIFIVTGLWLIGNKARKAFYFSIVGESCWIINALIRHDLALATICIVFLLAAIRGLIKWE